MNREIHVVLVVLAIEKRLELQRPELSGERSDLILELQPQILIILRGIEIDKLLKIIDLRNDLLPGQIAVLKRIQILEDLLCRCWIGPEIRGGCLFLKLLYLIFGPSLLKDASIQCRLLP